MVTMVFRKKSHGKKIVILSVVNYIINSITMAIELY